MSEYETYLNYILRFLGYRPRTEKEIRDKLNQRKASLEAIEQIISFLKEKKFIDDIEFARLWIESRKNFRVKSKRVIKMELLKKGVDANIVEQALSGGEGEEENISINDKEQAIKLIKKRISRYEGLPKQELYQKLGGFLARRGFDWETSKASIDAVLNIEYNKKNWQ